MSQGTCASRLPELTADALERHLSALREAGLSSRSVNFARQIAVAFVAWCVRTGRAASNQLRVVPKLDEQRDRRRVRRPLTDDELTRLLAVARERGREGWYLAAVLAGLRKGDLRRLTWADIDFDNGSIMIRLGKAKRADLIPMHHQLTNVLRQLRDSSAAHAADLVFAGTVTDLTRLKDFLRAGIARRVALLDPHGQPIMVGKGNRKRPKTRIAAEDEEGRVIDLHALRTTSGRNWPVRAWRRRSLNGSCATATTRPP